MNVLTALSSLGQSTKYNFTVIPDSCLGESIWPLDGFRPQGPEISFFKRIIPCSNIFTCLFRSLLGTAHYLLFSGRKQQEILFFRVEISLVGRKTSRSLTKWGVRTKFSESCLGEKEKFQCSTCMDSLI